MDMHFNRDSNSEFRDSQGTLVGCLRGNATNQADATPCLADADIKRRRGRLQHTPHRRACWQIKISDACASACPEHMHAM